MASLEEPCLQIIRKILFCKCPNTCPPKKSSTFKFAWFSLQVIRKIWICNCLGLQEKDEDEERGRKHGTSKHQALVAENTPPAAPGGTIKHRGLKHATRRHWKQKTCWRQEARRQGMSDTAPGASDTAQGGEWYGAGGASDTALRGLKLNTLSCCTQTKV